MRATTTRNDPRLRWAVAVALLLHGVLLASGSFRNTYDAWVHIFFGDHYARDWFSTWEPRWYTGFSVVSYPPATHQGIALLSGTIGLQWAFVVVQLAAIVNVVVGTYRFSLIWVSRTAAGWAAIFAAVSSALAEVVHTFGQLPTTFALGFLLQAQPSIHRWIRDGRRSELLAAIALLAATTAGHHVTTLFGSVFFTGPVALRAILDRWGTPTADEPAGHSAAFRRSLLAPHVARRLRRILPALTRTAVFGLLAVATLVVVVLPYWLWSSRDPIVQVPIPHASRNDFLSDRSAGLVFWLVPWLGILLLTPIAFIRAATGRGWPLAASTGLLALLGTGGTTPIPKLLLGGAFDILTLDRFTIWATVAILPFVGWAFASLVDGGLARTVRSIGGRAAPIVSRAVVAAVAIAACVFAATLTAHRPFQPAPIDPAPIVSFLEKDDHDRWRYLTLGFGDQMAWVSANTTAQTVDGNYHSARRLPELTTRSVERLEGAKYRGIPGLGSLQQFLTNPSTYHLKFVFSVDRFYDPLLWSTGWQRIGSLPDEVEVWERPDVPPLPDVLPVDEIPGWQRLMWGIIPLLSVTMGVAALSWFAAGRPRADLLDAGSRGPDVVVAPLRPLDRRLARTAERLRSCPDLSAERVAWQPAIWRDAAGRLGARTIERPAVRRAARFAAVTVAALAIVLGVRMLASDSEASPTARITAYYDALDFQRFADAHLILDPETRPDLDDYLLDVSLRDGLLAGYADLDAVTSTVDVDAATATADVELVFVTSVAEYRVERRHDLVRRDGAWFITPPAAPAAAVGGDLRSRTEVEVVLPPPATGEQATSIDRLLDRPTVDIEDVSAWREGDAWIVVGSVTNLDTTPADVTVTSTLRADGGEVLAAYDAGPATITRVLPGETVPFRVDVEGRAGSFDRNDPAAGAFDPDAYSAPVLTDEVDMVEVAARAVVAGGTTGRTVELRSAVVDDELTVTATVGNLASTSATVPRITTTYLSAAGRVLWVDHHWVPEAVLPNAEVVAEWALDRPDVVRAGPATSVVDSVDGEVAAGSIAGPGTLDVRAASLLIGDEPVAALRLDVTTFEREAPL